MFIALLIAGVTAMSAQPKIEVCNGTDTQDWKTVTPKDEPLKANVPIKNIGNETLIITEIKAGCGCTTARLDEIQDTLKPGESTNLPVTLRIGGATGDLTKTVRITSNDPNSKDKILFLKANIFHPIQMTPSYFAFNEMKVGSEASSAVKIKNNTDKNLTLSEIVMTPSNVDISLKKDRILKPGEEVEVTAKVKPDKSGYFNCTLKMKTSSKDYPELVISGYGKVNESPIFNSEDPNKK